MQQLQPGTTLQGGKYIIDRVLGQGGFGITYLAEHTSLDKLIAIKEFFPKDFCVRNESDNNVIISGNNTELIDRLRKRFMKEAKNIAKLDHPGIVKIHDVFQENGTAYYVMDYIQGDNLSNIVKQNGPLPEEKAIDYIVKVGEALEYMHSRKMTHFDVKPANIIIKKETDTPILVDFGLSKLYTSNNEETSTLLQAVSSGFSPIELYNGDSLTEFSPQSDVYSLGATLYFLLSGTTPPTASSLISTSLHKPSHISSDLFIALCNAMNYDVTNRTRTISALTRFLAFHLQDNATKTSIDNPFQIPNNGSLAVMFKEKPIHVFIKVTDIIGCTKTIIVLTVLFLALGYFNGEYLLSTDKFENGFNLKVFLFSYAGFTSALLWLCGIYYCSKLNSIGYTLLRTSVVMSSMYFISISLNNLFYRKFTFIESVAYIGVIISALCLMIYFFIKLGQKRTEIQTFLYDNSNSKSIGKFLIIILVLILLNFSLFDYLAQATLS